MAGWLEGRVQNPTFPNQFKSTWLGPAANRSWPEPLKREIVAGVVCAGLVGVMRHRIGDLQE